MKRDGLLSHMFPSSAGAWPEDRKGQGPHAGGSDCRSRTVFFLKIIENDVLCGIIKKKMGGMEMKQHIRALPFFICMLLIFAFLPVSACAEVDLIETGAFENGVSWR